MNEVGEKVMRRGEARRVRGGSYTDMSRQVRFGMIAFSRRGLAG